MRLPRLHALAGDLVAKAAGQQQMVHTDFFARSLLHMLHGQSNAAEPCTTLHNVIRAAGGITWRQSSDRRQLTCFEHAPSTHLQPPHTMAIPHTPPAWKSGASR